MSSRLIVLALLAAFASWKINRKRKDVRGLVATLRRGGVPAGRDLEPDEQWAEVFTLIIRDENSASPRLDYPPNGIEHRDLPGQAGRARPGPADDADAACGHTRWRSTGPGRTWGTGSSSPSATPGTRTGRARAGRVPPSLRIRRSRVLRLRRTTGAVPVTGAERRTGSAQVAGMAAHRPRCPARRPPPRRRRRLPGQDQGSTPTMPVTPTTAAAEGPVAVAAKQTPRRGRGGQ